MTARTRSCITVSADQANWVLFNASPDILQQIRSFPALQRVQAMVHLPQSGPGGMLEWLDQLPASTRKVLIHINNTKPILDEDSPQRQELTGHGIEVFFDGMEIEL